MASTLSAPPDRTIPPTACLTTVYATERYGLAWVSFTAEYFCVNPDDWSLQGRHLENRHYVVLPPDAHGWLWFATLQLWLGIYEELTKLAQA